MMLKIAVVDGNPADLGILRRMLNSSDLDVDLVEVSGAVEFQNLTHDQFDCALIDVRLPDGDGVDALIRVCAGKDYPPCPVIVMSMHGDEHTATRAFKAGANDYLIKDSLTPNNLKRTLLNAIDKWHAEYTMRNDWELQRHALQNAERANIAKTRFISNLSHQVRIPLTTIIGFAELIEAARLGDDKAAFGKYQEYAGDISRSAREVLDLMSSIIDLARFENGDSQITKANFDPRHALRQVIETFSEHADNAHVSVRVDDVRAPHSIESDDRAFKVIMTNLLSNAIKFTPAGQHVQVKLREVEGGFCVFSVEDSGAGMNPEDLGYLVRPFERYRTQVTSTGKDLGVGLPMVNSLVQTLGGDLRFETAPGRGTTATVVLPGTATDATRQ